MERQTSSQCVGGARADNNNSNAVKTAQKKRNEELEALKKKERELATFIATGRRKLLQQEANKQMRTTVPQTRCGNLNHNDQGNSITQMTGDTHNAATHQSRSSTRGTLLQVRKRERSPSRQQTETQAEERNKSRSPDRCRMRLMNPSEDQRHLHMHVDVDASAVDKDTAPLVEKPANPIPASVEKVNRSDNSLQDGSNKSPSEDQPNSDVKIERKPSDVEAATTPEHLRATQVPFDVEGKQGSSTRDSGSKKRSHERHKTSRSERRKKSSTKDQLIIRQSDAAGPKENIPLEYYPEILLDDEFNFIQYDSFA